MKRMGFGLVLTILLASGMVRSLLQPGYFPMHDDTQIARVVVMGRALRLGQFPVRWVSDLGYGYGYPLFNFYGPLPYYVGGTFYMAGVDPVIATKFMMAIGMLLAAIAMYCVVYPFAGLTGGVIAGTLLAYAPYHAVQLYVRGAVGELWATAFLPLVLYGCIKAWQKSSAWSVLVGGVGVAGVILSHTILGYITCGFLIVALCVAWMSSALKKTQSKAVSGLFPLLVIGLGLSAFFWLPAGVEMGYTNVRSQIGITARVTDHFVCPAQLWSMPWGFGGSAPGCVHDGLSFMIGKVQSVVALVSLGVFVLLRKRKIEGKHYMGIPTILALISLFLATNLSAVFWSTVPNAAFVQYPWRLLAYAMVSLAVVGGGVVLVVKNTVFRIVAMGVIVGVTIGVYSKYFTPQRMYDVAAKTVESTSFLRFSQSKISDEYLTADIHVPQTERDLPRQPMVGEKPFVLEREIEYDVYKKYFVTTADPQHLTLNTMYFPGWHYLVNGVEVTPVRVSGLPRIMVQPGRSAVELFFRNTWARTVGNAISILTLLALIYTYGKRTKQTHA